MTNCIENTIHLTGHYDCNGNFVPDSNQAMTNFYPIQNNPCLSLPNDNMFYTPSHEQEKRFDEELKKMKAPVRKLARFGDVNKDPLIVDEDTMEVVYVKSPSIVKSIRIAVGFLNDFINGDKDIGSTKAWPYVIKNHVINEKYINELKDCNLFYIDDDNEPVFNFEDLKENIEKGISIFNDYIPTVLEKSPECRSNDENDLIYKINKFVKDYNSNSCENYAIYKDIIIFWD